MYRKLVIFQDLDQVSQLILAIPPPYFSVFAPKSVELQLLTIERNVHATSVKDQIILQASSFCKHFPSNGEHWRFGFVKLLLCRTCSKEGDDLHEQGIDSTRLRYFNSGCVEWNVQVFRNYSDGTQFYRNL